MLKRKTPPTSPPPSPAKRPVRSKYDYLAKIPTSVVVNLDDLLTEKYKILCHVPVESGFFHDTVKDLIRRNSPEKRFELACRNEMLEKMRELGADDERIQASEPILRVAFRDHLSKVFLSNIGAKLKDLKDVRNSVIRMVDAAGEANSGCIPKSLRKELLKVFATHLQDGQSLREAATETTVSDSGFHSDTGTDLETATNSPAPNIAADILCGDTIVTGIQNDHENGRTKAEVTCHTFETTGNVDDSNINSTQETPAETTGLLLSTEPASSDSLNAPANVASPKLKRSYQGHDAQNISQHGGVKTHPDVTFSQNHILMEDINIPCVVKAPDGACNLVEITKEAKITTQPFAPGSSSSTKSESTLLSKATRAETPSSVISREGEGELAKLNEVKAHVRPRLSDSEVTCGHWFFRNPPCRYSDASKCRFTHSLRSFVLNPAGGSLISLEEARAIKPCNGRKKDHDVNITGKAEIKREHQISLDLSDRIAPTKHEIHYSSSTTPIVDVLWGYDPMGSYSPPDIHLRVTRNIRKHAGQRKIITLISDARGATKDYNLDASGGLKSKIGGILSMHLYKAPIHETIRQRLEQLLHPLVLANDTIFATVFPQFFGAPDREKTGQDTIAGHMSASITIDNLRAQDGKDRTASKDTRKHARAQRASEYSALLGGQRISCLYWYSSTCRETEETCPYDHCERDWVEDKYDARPEPTGSLRRR